MKIIQNTHTTEASNFSKQNKKENKKYLFKLKLLINELLQFRTF